jgi:hypothetical protein
MSFNHVKYFDLPVMVLKFIGLWFENNTSKRNKIFAFMIHVFFVEYNTFAFFVQTIKMLTNGTVIQLSDALGVFLALISATSRSIWFVARLENIKKVFLEFEEFIKFTEMDNDRERLQLEAHMNYAMRLLKIFFLCAFASNAIAGMMSLLNYGNRVLPYETWFIFDYKHNDVLFWILTFHQVGSASFVSAINGEIDGISMVFIAFTAGIIDELATKMSSIQKANGTSGNTDDQENVYEKLRKCVEVHKSIKNFTEIIATNLSFPFLVQTCVTSLIMCTSAYLLTTVCVF